MINKSNDKMEFIICMNSIYYQIYQFKVSKVIYSLLTNPTTTSGASTEIEDRDTTLTQQYRQSGKLHEFKPVISAAKDNTAADQRPSYFCSELVAAALKVFT